MQDEQAKLLEPLAPEKVLPCVCVCVCARVIVFVVVAFSFIFVSVCSLVGLFVRGSPLLGMHATRNHRLEPSYCDKCPCGICLGFQMLPESSEEPEA